MATVGLKFIKEDAVKAATAAAAGVKVEVSMSGSDHWITDETQGSLTRVFSIKLKG